MDFVTFYRRTQQEPELEEALLTAFGEKLEAGATLRTLLEARQGDLPTPTLRILTQRYAALKEWRVAAAPLANRVPAALLETAVFPHQLEALSRAVSAFPASDWERLLLLWNRCFSLSLKEGVASLSGTPGLGFDDYLMRTEVLTDIAPHRWLRLRRGQREEALHVSLNLPETLLREQCELLLFPQETLQRFVLPLLKGALERHLDADAERKAIEAARQVYAMVLTAPALEAAPVMALTAGRQVGAAVLDGEGKAIATLRPRAVSELIPLGRRYSVKAVVLPTRSSEVASLSALKEQLGAVWPITLVAPAGLAEAAEDLEYPRSIASAIVLGRRALRPLQEWSQLDPVRLGLAEFQGDLDLERLREALLEVRDTAQLEATFRFTPKSARLSVSIQPRRLEEVQAGQMLAGVITNITPFGAFVNVGLKEEGLIHVSEIADRFVRDPGEVVRIGQSVLAKVKSIDLGQRRLSLSLRREERPPAKASATEARTKALSELDKLFKK